MLSEEIKPYIDGNGLVAPNLTNGTGQGSDNGPMFTAEYAIMLHRTKEMTPWDLVEQLNRIRACVDDKGLLYRAPVGKDSDQEGPDDYYGVLAFCTEFGNTEMPLRMLGAVRRYFGFLNNNQPGNKTLESFLVRQPQLVASMVAAAYPESSVPHFLMRLLAFPFFLAAALIIATSCLRTPVGDTDARRLSWHLVQATRPSLMCRLASRIWYKRLYKDYPGGMKDVAKIYYRDNHPFQRYWVD